jgi:arylsulfatase A-like enzyme
VQDSPWHYQYRYPGQHEAKPGLYWPDGFPLNNIGNVTEGKRPPNNYREFDWGPLDKKDLEMGDGHAIQWAIDFLNQKHAKPFYLAVGTFRPHLPWYAPKKYFDLYPLSAIELPDVKADDLDDVPEPGQKLAKQTLQDYNLVVQTGKYKEAVQAYLAAISFVDSLLGRLLDALDYSEYGKNTIIVFWSDHGWHLGEKNHWHKMTLWERATRVPFIISAPGYKTNITINQPVNLIDIYPTLVELCQLSPKQDLDGNSLIPLLTDPQKNWHPTVTTMNRGNHAVRDERWRYIQYSDGSEELYDHKQDPHEWTNLAKNPEFESIKKKLQKWLPSSDAPNAPVKSDWNFDPKHYTWSKK